MQYDCMACGGVMKVVEVDDRQEWAWLELKCTKCGRGVTVKEDKESRTV